MAELMKMSGYAIATVALATITLVGIAVVSGFKTTGQVDNTTADLFVAGLTVFGTFMSIISLALVGKIIISIVRD
jgi:hypothetical protein